VIGVDLKLITACLIFSLTIGGIAIYIRKIIQGQIAPTKASWIIFCMVTSLSLSSFLATKFDLVSGAANCADMFSSTLGLITILICGRKEKIHFKSFEKYYLAAAGACLVFWLVSNNSFVTNLLVQGLTILGYAPTIHNILQAKKSGESKFAWSVWLSASILSLYPALANHNLLATIYSLRGNLMGGSIIVLTFKYPGTPTKKKEERKCRVPSAVE